MQEQIEQTPYCEKIRADYNESLAILQELKEQKNEEKNERQQ